MVEVMEARDRQLEPRLVERAQRAGERAEGMRRIVYRRCGSWRCHAAVDIRIGPPEIAAVVEETPIPSAGHPYSHRAHVARSQQLRRVGEVARDDAQIGERG